MLSISQLPMLLGALGLLVAWGIYRKVLAYSAGEGKVVGIADKIHRGAMVFMRTEYTYLAVFVAVVAALIAVLLAVFVYWTPAGRHLYAVGGNIKAAALSGIGVRKMLFMTYTLCGLLSAIAGMLLTARLETGEANIGASMPLGSIAACVIAGVSLRGGVGRMENVILGALFIGLVQNGMNLARIESYLQTVVLGVLLILAVVADQLRLRYISGLRT